MRHVSLIFQAAFFGFVVKGNEDTLDTNDTEKPLRACTYEEDLKIEFTECDS